MKRPRSDVVMRRFMAGEDMQTIALSHLGPDAREDYQTGYLPMLVRVEAALRRAMLKSEKRRKRSQ